MRAPGLAGVLLACLVALCSAQQRDFDPCQTGQKATVGKPYVVGFAYLPGGELADWVSGVDENNNTVFRNPCNPEDQQALQAMNISTSVYSLKVETLQLLRRDDNLELLAQTFGSPVQVLSVVAFNGDFLSQPRVILSNESALTEETGSAMSIPLILQFTQGSDVVGYWDDRPCGTCSDNLRAALSASGYSTDYIPQTTCLNSITCAVEISSCAECLLTGSSQQQATCLTLCSTSYNIGFAGTDRNLQPLITSFVVSQSDDYSMAGLFTDQVFQAANATWDVFNSVVDGVTGLFG
mmetsp:Transcript_25315/g.70794  ORF Transcript_25315/g.70794 Transcript_25315/m.70794 type:complete len:295 (-) Transcript_25315:15-899(-)